MRLPAQLLKRKADSHKGDYGHILVIGGSPGLSGAVCLCSCSALRAGAGLVTVAIPKFLSSIFEVKLTEVMSLPLKDKQGYLVLDSFREIKKSLNKIDVIVIGPGAARKLSTQKLIIKIIKEIDKPIVVDADGLNALVGNLDVLNERKTKHLVFTPHEGEFARLLSLSPVRVNKERKDLVKKFALRYNLTLVLKGNRTLVSDARSFFENTTGNPGMATGGSGDVLTGIIAALVSQGLKCFEAAKLGVYLHGLAGDYAVKDKTQICLIASDIIEYLPKAIKSLSKQN